MNEKTNPNSLTESYPAQRVSDDLRLRVKRLAAQHDDKASQRARSKRKRRLIFSYGTAAAVIGGGIFAQPKFAAAAVIARIEKALDGVRNVHEVTWEQGRNTERWWKVGETSRTEYPDSTVVVRDGKRYQWLRGSNKVIVRPEPKVNLPRSGFTMASLMRDLKRSGWIGSLETMSNSVEDGKTFQRFQVTMKSWEGTLRVLLVVDPTTQLPKRYESFIQRESTWEPLNRTELEYNLSENPARFAGEFPGARVVDAQKEKESWYEKIEHPIASLGPLKIRDIRTNPQGAIFVLYTDGRTYDQMVWKPSGQHYGSTELPEQWTIEIAGARYRSVALYSSHSVMQQKSKSNLANPLLRDGQALQGKWFIPLDPKPCVPTKVTLRLTKTDAAFRGSLSLSVPAQADFQPDYWPYLVATVGNSNPEGKELRKRFESMRSDELMHHRASLPQALEAIEAEEALGASPNGVRRSTEIGQDHHFLVKKAQVLGLLGQKADAEKALQQALTQHADQIRRFPKKYTNDYFFWEQVCTAWYAIGDETKAVEMREKAIAMAQHDFPGRVTWYREHPEDLKPKLD